MFQFLRPKLTQFGPVEFRDDIVIEQAAEKVYALLDWASPDNAYRARGSRVEMVEGEDGQFTMLMDELPDLRFDMLVTEAVPHTSYGFVSVITPSVGRLLHSHEQYSVDALGPASCRLGLVNTIVFCPMRPEDMGQEELMVSTANHNALAKLKLQAEQGVDAVRAVAGKLVV